MNIIHPPALILKSYFQAPDKVTVTPIGKGNINNTFLANSPERTIVIQHINEKVFHEPAILIHNLQQINNHLNSVTAPGGRRWKNVELLPDINGAFSIKDHRKRMWRALNYIDGTVSIEKVETPFQAFQAGWALGRFHKDLADINLSDLGQPLPGFHHLSSYLSIYDELENKSGNEDTNEKLRRIIDEHRQASLTLERAAALNTIKKKVIHGDPKVGNILFDRHTGLAVSVIDLDTVGPGLVQHDIGDCLRSICNRNGELGHSGKILFDLDLCANCLRGYFLSAGDMLEDVDPEYIFDGITAITFELGVRFFNDFQQGNIYFKCQNRHDTINRAGIQLALLLDIMRKERQIRDIIRKVQDSVLHGQQQD